MRKNNFAILKYRYYAYAFSLILFVAGIICAFVFGGFNTGIDFGSGFSERIQIAPRGLSISYLGSDSVDASVSGGDLIITIRSSSGIDSYTFTSSEYKSVDSLAKGLEKIGLNVDLVDGSLLVSNFVPGFGFPAAITANPVGLNYATETRDVDIDDIRAAMKGVGSVNVQTLGKVSDGGFQIKINVAEGETQADVEHKINDALFSYFGEDNVVVLQSDFVGPKFSSDLLKASVVAIILAIVLILVYIAFRFRIAYAVSSILALAHDVAAMLCFILIFQLEVSSTTIAAVLTIIGYSLNNTIVIFDRIRENVSENAKEGVWSIINKSVRQSFSRTIITSVTTLVAILPLAIFSSGDIKIFAINLTWGIVIGTYSSNFLAPAFLSFFNRFAPIDKVKEKANDEVLAEL